MAELRKRAQVKFAKILVDGKFHIECDENEEGATKRTVEAKTPGEVDKHYTEQLFDELAGNITSIEIKDGDYGRVLYISVDNEIVITAGVSGSFGQDLLKKIPNIEINKEVVFTPYSFTAKDTGKSIKGVTIMQEGNKLSSFFQEGTGKDTKNLHGYPEVAKSKKPNPSEKTAWKKFWNKYFEEVEDFLVAYISKNHIIKYTEDSQEESINDNQTKEDIKW